MLEFSDMRVMAIDPGKTTGVAVFDGQRFDSYELDSSLEGDVQLCRAIQSLCPRVVICESFRITAQTAKNTQAPWSLEQIGVVRLSSKIVGAKFVLQSPADAKGFSTDAKLKAIQWYVSTPGGHRNDAARHLLAWLVRQGWMDERLYQ